MHISISPHIPVSTTDLWLGSGLFQQEIMPQFIKKWGHRAVIIADHAVVKLYGEQLSAHCNAEMIVIPQTTSRIKSRETKEWIEDQLFAGKYGRDTVLIAIGGGVITDLVGFIASTYMRGVPLILIPTTLLGIVDAALGGKTGIDTTQGKNLLGTYYPPKAIIADLGTLAYLPQAEWQNGLAEILKAGLIADRVLWTLCDHSWRSKLEQIVSRAIQVKISTIEHDPLEKGLRRILNFGHTVAHALESAASYQIAHGEAVAIGLMAESYLSMKMGLLEEQICDEIMAKIEASGFSLSLPSSYNRAQFLEAMTYDKKTARGIPRFTLIRDIGEAAEFNGEYCSSVPEELVLNMLEWIEGKLLRTKFDYNLEGIRAARI